MVYAIHAVNLRKRYVDPLRRRRIDALRGVDVSVVSGRIVVLLGPNGAGKSTLLSILLGTVAPSGGTVRFFGETTSPPIGFVPEVAHLPRWISARSYVAGIARLGGTSADAERWLEEVGLGDHADRPIARLSKGLRQRVAIAQAFLPGAPIVLCDEPSSGLDPAGRVWLRSMLADERRRGRTIVTSTHDVGETAAIADEVHILRSGRIVASVRPREHTDPKRAIEETYLATEVSPS